MSTPPNSAELDLLDQQARAQRLENSVAFERRLRALMASTTRDRAETGLLIMRSRTHMIGVFFSGLLAGAALLGAGVTLWAAVGGS